MNVESQESWTGLLPTLCPETQPFWDACNQNKFIVQKCQACGNPQYHYRAFCCHCWSEAVEDRAIEGTGTVWTFSVVNRNLTPAFASWGRYVVGVVEVPEGVKIVTKIETPDPDSVRIGTPVRLAFARAENGQNIPFFRTVS
ncbi:Zn-ribbon domain-containing OB-fold protein [Microvirga zambiensis]|uniref:Zn-ribbon domain-containing OB-fold protein n=1 Tax=Microvirga zambiensis TaxID=1402137 RepID=UPI00191E8410|nr:OB-fold domain-containing protein [Microvirga zambiensis]